MPSKITTVLLIDEKNMIVEGLSKLLDDHARIRLVGASVARETNTSMLRELAPDVVVFVVFDRDLAIDTVRELGQETPGVRILVVSKYTDKTFVTELLSAGVQGILMDDSPFADLVQAISAEREKWNQICLDARIVAAWTGASVDQRETQSNSLVSVLTESEKRVFQLLVDGRHAKQIAGDLRVSTKTVDAHRRRMMKKLSISNIVDLVKLAIREGLTTVNPSRPK